MAPKLPDIETLKDVRLQVPLRVYSLDRKLIAEFGEMKRSPLSYEEFPQQLIHAVLAAEDDRFFEHPGVDYKGILRAAFQLVRSGGERRQGGSTITMQVARNFFLSPEKTFHRKFNEIFLALKIENELSKQEIMSLYLNKIYLGKRSYGFAAAAQVYYGKPLAELSLAQTAMLAGLPKAPSRYNPIVNLERAMVRRKYVLERMLELGFITQEVFEAALNEADDASVHAQAIELEAPYVAEMVRTEILNRYGNDAYTAGLNVYTTIDSKLQTAANSALRNALLGYDRRHGYRGHIQHIPLFERDENFDIESYQTLISDIDETGNLTPAVVIQVNHDEAFAVTKSGRLAFIPWEKMNWARRYINDNSVGPELQSAHDILKTGDVIYVTEHDESGCSWLAQIPTVAGALVSMHPQDGAITALVGGFNYYESKFNRAIQAERQPGSSFKPFIYSAAIDKGFTAASIINDAPVVFDAPGLEDTWRPENYSGKFFGPTRLRKALTKSRNLVSIRLLRDIGTGYAVRYARRFGLERAKLPHDLSLALGSGTLTPLELASSYSVFANGGYRIGAYFIDSIAGSDDSVLYLNKPAVVCEQCADADEQLKQQLAEIANADDKADNAVAENTSQAANDSENAQTPAPADQQQSLQAFIVDEDNADQNSLEATLKRERHFNEGPPALIHAPRILSKQTSFIMNSMMRDVIRRGTGVSARSLGRKDLAGKTGTTNDQRDAWFAGFNQNLVAVCWVGFDNPKPLGNRETGARAALPMWIDYMGKALKGQPETVLVQPEGMVSVRINEKTGEVTHAGDPDAIFEYFLADQVPQPGTDTGNPGQPSPYDDETEQLF